MQPFIEQPQFLLEPKSSYLVDGRPVRLECRAIRARQIFFNCHNKWVPELEHDKSTTVNEKGQLIIITSIELKTDEIESNQGYKCFCQAWSATGGTLRSHPATIEIAYLEKIFDWEPLRTDGVIGKSTEFRCRPPMGHPYPKVTWFKDNQPVEINRNGRLILSNENSLLIASVEKGDAGNYTCVASNLAGSYSSEPAELIVHDDRGWSDWQPFSECKGIPCSKGRQRRIRTCLNPPTINNRASCDGDQMQEKECSVPCITENNQTDDEFGPWSNCTGIPCQMGHQQRRRICLKTSFCKNDQTQERDCFVPCSKKAQTHLMYSNWTDWSVCQSPECTSTRTRKCLQEFCPDDLMESRTCENSLCPNIPKTNVHNTAFNFTSLVYISAVMGVLVIFLVAVLCIHRHYRHQQRRNRKKSKRERSLSTCITSKTTGSDCQIEKNDYPFYYSIQQDTTSTRSSASQNNSYSVANVETSVERDKSSLYHCSPLKFSGTMRFNENYQRILQSLPPHTDLRYLSVSILNHRGCRLEIPHTGVTLTIPEDAVLRDEDHLIYVVLLDLDCQMPLLSTSQTRLSPVILIGPSNITLLKPAVLSFEHSALIDGSSWKLQMMHTDDLIEWKSILTSGHENISTPVYLQFSQDNRAFLLFESMGGYILIGESNSQQQASKYLQMACFYSQSNLRIRLFPRTADAFERCLNEECSMNHYLCDQPKLFLLNDNKDQLSLNIDYELSSTSRIHIGYRQIPFETLWNNRFERSCFLFNVPDLQMNPDDSFAVHVDLYQATILDNAFHTRISIDRIRMMNNTAYSTVSHLHRQRSKSSEKLIRLPAVLRQTLCQLLDPPNILGNDWRMLANHLLDINYLQYFATKISPTEHLLTLWEARHESLVNLINVLNQIGRSDAACLLLTQVNITA